MRAFFLFLCRFSLCAWVGAAALFVTAGVAEIRSNQFDTLTINQLVAARFPHYYNFGFTLVVLGGASAFLAMNHSAWSRGRATTVGGLCIAALGAMVYDYLLIFLPLLEMMESPTLDAQFKPYHEASKNINSVSLTIVLVACCLASWTGTQHQTESPVEVE